MHVPGVTLLALAALLYAGLADAAAPSAESVALARTLVEKTGTGGMAAMNGLALPFPHLMGELGVTDPSHYGAVVHDDIMAVLNDHTDSLTDIQVTSYATLLTPDDMKAAIAFYGTPAGQKLIKIRFKLLQTNMAQAGDLLETLKPAIAAKTQETLKVHGWDKN